MSSFGLEGVLPTLDGAATSQVQRASKRMTVASRLSEIARLRNQAQESGHAEGYRDGYAAGLAAGAERGFQDAHQEAKQRLNAQLDRFGAHLDQVGESVLDAIQRWYGEAEQSLASLSVLIAERVIAREVQASKETILSIARDALLEVTHAAEARIRVNPFESEVLREHREEIMTVATSLKHIEIVDDASVHGGCVIETDGGVIDATIATKLKTILEATRRAA